MLKIYNTLTKKIEDFKPIVSNVVKLYSCGPTVYDYYHIGNLRNAVFNDTLRRTLEICDYHTKHIMNITDVGHLVSDEDDGDDKLEKGAKREGKTVWEVAEHYSEAFKKDMQALNILPPNAYKDSKRGDNYARATDFINEQIEMVKILLDKEHAYITDHAIYFDVTSIKNYGELSGQKLSEKTVGSRKDVVTDKDKKNPHDFAIWFFAIGHFASHTMQWESPWGNGFPGWHLECSAIIHATLGDPIDIHTGGVDHIGTHHPNEIAQTEATYGNKLANYWLHNEFVLVDGKKMSKSKNNSFNLKDITDKGFDPMALRLLYLQAHYRTELNFSWENLEAAKTRLNGWQATVNLTLQLEAAEQDETIEKLKQAITNDLDTPKSLAIISEYFDTLLNKVGKAPNNTVIDFIENVLGIKFDHTDISDDIKAMLRQRTEAREKLDWDHSDKLRDKLKQNGVGVGDSPLGQIWYRI